MSALDRLKADVAEPLEDAPDLVSCLQADLALALAVVEAAGTVLAWLPDQISADKEPLALMQALSAIEKED